MPYRLARDAWDMLEQERLANASNAGLGSGPLRFREDSITDYLLWKLYTMAGPFKVHKVGPWLEAKNGADFEVWMRISANDWLGLRFQAKRVHGASYTELKHESRNIGQNAIGTRWQHDDLIQSSHSDNMLALYVFYNEWQSGQFSRGRWPIDSSEHILMCSKTLDAEDPRAFGCGVMAAEDVQNVFLGGRAGRKVMHLPKFFPFQLPWHYLWERCRPLHRARSVHGPISCPICSRAVVWLISRARRGHPRPHVGRSGPGVWKHDDLPGHVRQMLRPGEPFDNLDFGGWAAPRYTVVVDQSFLESPESHQA